MPQRSTNGLLLYLMHLVLLCGFLCLPGVNVRAASLFGKVIEVNSGDVITIFNLNRPVRVKFLGIDAPELNQEFGEAARKHLSDLVLDKSVLVEYWGIAADKSLTGRVLLNGADVGAQMVRDGVAWSDPNNQSRLSVTDREVYQQSELAARAERRGLWQEQNPTAPWDFVRAEQLKKYPVVAPGARDPFARARRDGPTPELTNLTLMAGSANGAGKRPMTRDEISASWDSLSSSNKNLHELRPPSENFSVLVPDEGRRITQPIDFNGESVDINLYMARDGANLYAVMWFTGPSYGETDKVAIDSTVPDMIKAAHKSYQEGDRGYFLCSQQRQKDISINGYAGREFDMSSCSLPTRARAFTKVVDNHRQMYIGIVFYGDDDQHVTQFIKSFIAGRKQAQTAQQ